MSRTARQWAQLAEAIHDNHPVDPVTERLEARLRLVDQLVDRLELANQPPTTTQPPTQPVEPVVARRSALDVVVAHYPTAGWPLVLTTAQWSMVAGAAGWEWVPAPLAALIFLSVLPARGRPDPTSRPTAHGRRS